MSQDTVTQRWRKPVVPLGVEEESTHYTLVNGRETLEFSARFKPEDIDRFRLGYCCMNCWEPHETPMPEKCSLCSFPMKRQQMEVFLETFKGTKRDPRAARIESELDRVDDKHERNFYVVRNGILVPKTI